MEQPKKRLSIAQTIFLTLLIVGTVVIIARNERSTYRQAHGMTFGTLYNVTYKSDKDLDEGIMAAMNAVDKSLSMFNPNSTLSRINRNESLETDAMVADVLKRAIDVAKHTNGAFDVTVAPLVNAWGFGYKHGKMPTDAEIDSMLQIVGCDKVKLVRQNGKDVVVKTDDRLTIDLGAIAKGYATDAVAHYLQGCGVENYMVEIGGEVVARGVNSRNEPWRIGISKPVDDTLSVNTDVQTILSANNIALATSGNYRNFYYHNGKKYAHTIDPKSGRPVQHSLLSATVVATDCATADAYATAFMVMGTDKTKKLLEKRSDIMAYLIYSDDNGHTKVWHSQGLNKLITK